MKQIWRSLTVLLCVALLSSVGSFLERPHIGFSLYSKFAPKDALCLAQMDGWEEETVSLTLDELKADPRVTFSSTLMLVNAEHPLPQDYVPQLEEYNGAKMHPLMVPAYVALRDATVEATGERIYVSSDFRTKEEQEAIIAESEAGIAAPVGCSEHEAGLALDVYAPYYGGINFPESAAGMFVNLRCEDFGYIIRYPRDKEHITGISYEPWHLRYVGVPHAKCIMESGLALEEYLTSYQPSVWYDIGDGYYVLRTEASAVTLPIGMDACTVSPDNMGYLILTLHLAGM